MIKRMETRIKFIKQAVEVHLKTLKYETGDSYDPSISKLNTKQKLKILMLNQEFIVKSSEKGNTLRMQGVNQSYYMFDAYQYKDHKLMLGLINKSIDKDDSGVTNNSRRGLLEPQHLTAQHKKNDTGLT